MSRTLRIALNVCTAIAICTLDTARAQDGRRPAPPPSDAPPPGSLVVRGRAAAPPRDDDDVHVREFADVEVEVVPHGEFPPRIRHRGTRWSGDGDFQSVFLGCAGVAGHVEVTVGNAGGGARLFFRQDLAGQLDVEGVIGSGELPVLVSGRVRRADGEPAPDCDVQVRVLARWDHSAQPRNLSAVTDDAGRFEIRGAVHGDVRMEVIATRDEMSSRPAPLPTTGAKVDLALGDAATARGKLELPAGFDASELEVVVRGPGVARRQVWVRGAQWTWAGDGIAFPAHTPFTVGALVPGRHEFSLRLRGSSRPVARTTVDLAPGACEVPPLRLGGFRTISVRVLGPAGSPARAGRIWSRAAGDRGALRTATLDDDGRTAVPFVGDEVEIAARAAGASLATLTTRSSDVEIRLEPATPTPVRISLPPAVVRPGAAETPAVWRGVVIRWIAPPDAAAEFVDGVWDAESIDPRADEVVELPVPAEGPIVTSLEVPGWYFVGYLLRKPGRTSTSLATPLLVDGGGRDVVQELGVPISRLLEMESR